jgi:hypothetical protein
MIILFLHLGRHQKNCVLELLLDRHTQLALCTRWLELHVLAELREERVHVAHTLIFTHLVPGHLTQHFVSVAAQIKKDDEHS